MEDEADELASDSDDEKRLYRAQKERENKKWKAMAALKKKPRPEGPTKQHNGGAGMRPKATKQIGSCYTWRLGSSGCHMLKRPTTAANVSFVVKGLNTLIPWICVIVRFPMVTVTLPRVKV